MILKRCWQTKLSPSERIYWDPLCEPQISAAKQLSQERLAPPKLKKKKNKWIEYTAEVFKTVVPKISDHIRTNWPEW